MIRRNRLDSLLNNEENEFYDTIYFLIENTGNIKEINDDSSLAKDIINLNQTLLMNARDKTILENQRKIKYEEEEYNRIEEEIQLETDINKLKNDFNIRINNLKEEFLTKSRDKLYQDIELRINILESIPKQPKHPLPIEDEEDIPTRNIDKASETRNLIGDTIRQINYIISEYKKTLSDDDKRFFNKVKTSNVRQMIKEAYEKSLDKRLLLNVFYNIWVLSKDNRFLLSKGFTKKKIQEGKKLSEEINNYLYTNTLMLRNMELPRLKKKSKYNLLETRPRIYLKSSQSFLMNPLGFPEEKIDNIKNVQVIID